MAKQDSTAKAAVSVLTIGHISFEVLMLPDGSFAIAVPQVADLFSLSKVHASRDFKALIGKDFSFAKTTSELNSKAVNILTLLEFELLVAKLDRAGNIFAQKFRDSLIGLALYQLSCDAFNIKFEKQDRQKWLKERQEGKSCRRSLTDATKLLIDQGEKLNYGYITLQTYQSCNLVTRYREYKATRRDDNFRDTLSDGELRNVSKFEELTADFIMVDRLPLSQAMLNASRYIR